MTQPEKQVYTRRDFFSFGLFKTMESVENVLKKQVNRAASSIEASKPPHSIAPRVPFVRPPGAIEESEFLKKCTQCNDCIKACPHFVIRKAGYELGKEVAETPIIIPNDNPCLMCDGLPCIQSCTTGALLPYKEEDFVRIGVAVVSEDTCYQSQGQPCDYCNKHCPVRPKAIDTSSLGEVAKVDSQRCNGCGHCAQICPANSIWIEDRRER